MRSLLPAGIFILGALVLTVGFQNCSLEGAPQNAAEVASQASVNCGAGEIPFQGTCHAQYISCSLAGGGSGQQPFINGSYGSCSANACGAGFHIENSICINNKKSCASPNAVAEQTWNGTAYGACAAVSCTSADYILTGGACAGPAQPVYRYKNSTSGTSLIYTFYWSLVNNDPAPLSLGRPLEGVAFSLFKAANADAQIALYNCRSSLFAFTFVDQVANCSGSGLGQLLGYASAVSQPTGQNKALYTCGTSKVIVSNTVDCAGLAASIIGYSF